MAARRSDTPDISPNVIERIRLEADNTRIRSDFCLESMLDIFQADGANLALCLRDDVCRPQAPDETGIDLVNTCRGAKALLYQPIDFRA